jgi:glycosyltransferase involved in cell wall biosynthesis
MVTIRVARVVYLTIDGVLDHLGFSQVLRVIERLAAGGIRYSLVSMERARDLRDDVRVREVRARLRAAGIDWHAAPYREGAGGRGALENLLTLGRLAVGGADARSATLVHARGYHGALIALSLRRALGVPYLFDARGLAIDERLEERRWFTSAARLTVARRIERRLYRDAEAVVTLTELHRDHVRAYRRSGARQTVVIPTCADFEAFASGRLERLPLDAQSALRNRRVLGIVGSLNRAYRGDIASRLAAEVLRRDIDSRLLVLSGQHDEWRSCLVAAGVPMERVVLARANHESMPDWLSAISWGLLVLTEDTVAKSAMMPTKLAEFFAAGVRPVVHGCNPEMRSWVERAGSGLVLPDLEERSLANAVDRMCLPLDVSQSAHARAVVAPHFSLAAGARKYASLLGQIAGPP